MAKQRKRVIVDGKEKWVSGDTMQELFEAAAKLIAGGAGGAVKPQQVLFKPYAEKWKRLYKDNKVRHTTLSEYSSILRKHLIPAFGEMDIASITTDDVQEFMNNKADYARKTIREMVLVLGMILGGAVEDGIITRNPARSKRLINPSSKESTRDALTREEALDIIAHLPDLRQARDRQYVALFVYTGMRREEVLGLRWRDVDFERGILYVRQAVTFSKGKPVVDKTKTKAGTRAIPMNPALAEWLDPKEPDVYVIGGKTNPTTEATVRRMWERIAKQINVYGKTPHYFRHTFMTFALRAGVKEKTLQTIGGYADVTTLRKVYTHTQEEDIAAATPIINGMFDPVCAG